LVKLGSKSSRKKLINREKSNRAHRRYEKRLQKLRIWLAARVDDGRYTLKWHESPMEAVRNRRGTVLFSTLVEGLFFDHLLRKRYLERHPDLFKGTDGAKIEIGFPQSDLREAYDAYRLSIEQGVEEDDEEEDFELRHIAQW
jgi:hypothetical protein